MAAIDAQALTDLCSQLTGRCEHEGTNGSAVGGFLGGEMMENG